MSADWLTGKRPDDEENTGQGKRNAENLTHIEDHVGLESHLIVLYELNEETCGKSTDKEGAEEETPTVATALLPVHPHHESEQGEICQRLVNLRGVACKTVVQLIPFRRTDKLEAPGEVGGIAENLAVHKVADAYKTTGRTSI